MIYINSTNDSIDEIYSEQLGLIIFYITTQVADQHLHLIHTDFLRFAPWNNVISTMK